MIATALLPLMFITPAAEDPTPIDAPFVEAIVGSDALSDLCSAYSELVNGFIDLGLDYSAMSTFVDMADAYVIVMMEGDTMRLLPDARDTLTAWLHSDCS